MFYIELSNSSLTYGSIIGIDDLYDYENHAGALNPQI